MIISSLDKVPLEKCPALVLNADFRPLSYYPLSLWCWQDAVKSVFLNRVSIVSNYKRKIRSPSFEMNLPSVIALKSFVKPSENPTKNSPHFFLCNCGKKYKHRSTLSAHKKICKEEFFLLLLIIFLQPSIPLILH